MGGHQARKLALPKGAAIVKVAVNRGEGSGWGLQGLRMWLDNGRAMGALNKSGSESDIIVLSTLVLCARCIVSFIPVVVPSANVGDRARRERKDCRVPWRVWPPRHVLEVWDPDRSQGCRTAAVGV